MAAPPGSAVDSQSLHTVAITIVKDPTGKLDDFAELNPSTLPTSITSTNPLHTLPEDGSSELQLDDGACLVAEHLRIPYAEVDFAAAEEIGHGGFSVVYACDWQGRRVVLKVVRPALASKRQRVALVREAVLMRDLQHPAVARVYGVIDEPPHHALVMQYYKRGTLEEFMCSPSTSDVYEALSLLDRLRLACQVADGMAYLHSRNPPIIHGDLKASNLLVDEDNQVVITDFGLAVQLMSGPKALASPSTSPSAGGAGSYSTNFPPSLSIFSTLWTSPTSALSIFISPPEVIAAPQAPRKAAADVYAFGITLWQILVGRVPYRGMNAAMLVSAVKRGKRPVILEKDQLPQGLVDLINECWAQDEAERPRFAQVTARLKQQMQELQQG